MKCMKCSSGRTIIVRVATAPRAVRVPAAVLRAAVRAPAAVREEAHLEPAQAHPRAAVRALRLAAARAAPRPAAPRAARREKWVIASPPSQCPATVQGWTLMATPAILAIRQSTIGVVTD